MPAYAYLRKSSVHDPIREISHELQEAAVRELAARHGDNHGGLVILSDWDKSGRLGADKRPGYAALLSAIASGQATAVYSYSLSRLGRSLPELARLIKDCEERGIPVRLTADPVDTSTASGRLLTHVLASVAQFEADVASERVRAANAAKRAAGRPVSSVRPYGSKAGESESAVLAAFRNAGSYSGAARLLNERGIKPRNSKRGVWWPSSVAVVVKRLDPSVARRRPTRGYAAGGTDFLLARLLRCPTCGTMLSGTRDRLDGPNRGRVRYACRLGTVTPHPRVSISEHLIVPAIRAEVDHLVLPGDEVGMGDDSAARADLEARKTRIVDLYASGHIDRDDRDARLAGVYDALAQLDANRVRKAIPSIDWAWQPRALNSVLRAIFESIQLDPDTFAPVRFDWRRDEWRTA
jgi:DNA invertase Pin-like site-specific DNA recombinase